MATYHIAFNTQRITIATAGAARTSGTVYDEDGFHGIALHDADSGAAYEMGIDGIWWMTLASATVGAFIYITTGGALTLTAGTNKKIAKCYGATETSGPYNGMCKALLLPQSEAEAS